MRVLHVYRTYFPDPPGGMQEVIRNIALATRDHGVETRVFTLSPTPHPVEVDRPEAKVVRARSWMAPASCDLGSLESFRLFLAQAAWADIVHFHFPWPFLDLLNLALPRGKPRLLTYHSDIVRQRFLGALYAPLMRYTLRAMPRIVVGSPNYAASSKILQSCVAPEKLSIIPFGLVERAAPNQNTSTILQRLNISAGGYFLALGVLRYYKGLHTLIRAAKSIDAPVVIAGSGSEGDNLRALAKETGATNIIFAGQVSEDEKTALLGGCKAFVFPSHLRSEAFGIALVEAAMMGKPMISCEIGTGTSFVNKDGESGIVIPPENPSLLAAAMSRLLTDNDLTTQYGAGARARYENLFTAQKMGASYASLYQSLIPR
ncbi:MAG: glycosyltransferase [Alphaproteobacteria bacterium]|nr:glycosyltransferase [Alphaproteobacteria bacterium]